MRPISVQVDEKVCRDLKSLAERTGRSVAELIREEMSEYLGKQGCSRGSIFDVRPHDSGAQLRPWTREELMDETLDR